MTISEVSNTFSIPLSFDMPVISSETIDLIKSYGFEEMPDGLPALKDKIKSVEMCQSKLKNTLKHSVRDKIIVCLSTLFAVSLLACCIFGTYYIYSIGQAPGFIAVSAIGTCFVYGGLGFVLNKKIDSTQPSDSTSCATFNLARPLIRIFGAIPRYAKEIKSMEDIIKEELKDIKMFYMNNLWNLSNLENAFEEDIRLLKNKLVETRVEPKAYGEYKKKFELANQAHAELKRFVHFFGDYLIQSETKNSD
jgi:hypothetical protein